MADYIYEGAPMEVSEAQELTEPASDAEEGAEESYEDDAEEQELTEPAEDTDEYDEEEEYDEDESYEEEEDEEDVPQGKRSRDHAFAEMRRAREEAERRNQELQSQLDEIQRAQKETKLREYAEGMGFSEEEIEQIIADAAEEERKENERNGLIQENERLNEKLLNLQVDEMMRQDLIDIQEIDPTIKSLEDLGDDFFTFRAAMDGVDAYYAVMSKRERTSIKPAPSIGKANQASISRDFYTSEELDNLSDEEIRKNWEKVQRSLDRL